MKPQQRLTEAKEALIKEDTFFVPDLCQINSVLFVLILTQLLALVFTLLTSRHTLINWEQLGLISFLCQSIALSCAALICWSRDTIKKQGLSVVVGHFMGVIIGITALYSWLCSKLFLNINNFPEFFMLKNTIISGIIGALLLRYFYLQFQWREQKQAELKARIEALQARIKPHFLFNSMNTIASLISISPQQAEDAVLDLSSLFRATLDNQTLLIPLEEEIALCRRYLNIEGLRLGDRLHIDWDLEPKTLQIKIPPLILQPLVENAIYHGIQPRTNGGTITIKSHYENKTLYILVSNPYNPELERHHGNHIALDNIRSRLSALFDARAVIKTSQLDGIYTATLRIPVK